ncbi:predicted protein [Chaetomium globosum CBS 148.51]|uniref:Uncharacterized protein n=1 Tax=Chaetomium globosum (strain ATCC 6205 / CBS 148.51 / DSM 1962 / NBRC 6347 / NRRL 1970) TaxID=306901 RepID=Q2H7Q9_CHAGB|nr:uncharacterized protein CHGG_05306 [Chaetomium globosum CBS 148.51]EAQ88687.1 predicted protein [Chaetomium globosum CBS 148.51]
MPAYGVQNRVFTNPLASYSRLLQVCTSGATATSERLRVPLLTGSAKVAFDLSLTGVHRVSASRWPALLRYFLTPVVVASKNDELSMRVVHWRRHGAPRNGLENRESGPVPSSEAGDCA